jgi:hypothetical protein
MFGIESGGSCLILRRCRFQQNYGWLFRVVMGCNLESFSLKYHDVGKAHLTISTARHSFMALQYICHFTRPLFSARLQSHQQGWSTHVDLALRLDVLAVCAVFAFIGAILLGAF